MTPTRMPRPQRKSPPFLFSARWEHSTKRSLPLKSLHNRGSNLRDAAGRAVHWEPKPAPIILTQYSVVTDVDRFIRMTLLELSAALAGKRWQSGHRNARELVDRLEQCGVRLEIED
jgi:hypothetical protein